VKQLAPALVVLLSAARASAGDADEALSRYYDEEDRYNGVYVGLGSTLIASGVALATRDDDGLRAAGYPAIAVGGIQLVVGASYLVLTRGWKADAEAALRRGVRHFVTSERERVGSVEPSFFWFKLADATVALTGLAIGIGGAASGDDVVTGVGAGLGVSACTELVMGHITHDIARRYLRDLDALDVALGPGSLKLRTRF
jgi:hypothetical protein